MTIKGSCLCDAVHYQIVGPFRRIGNCHCSMCRKANGAALVTWGIIEPDQFRWLTGEAFVQVYRYSAGRDRLFCRQCGSPLANGHAGSVGEVVIGTVDGDPGGQTQEHIFTGSKAIRHEITDALPQHEAWPPGKGA